MADLMNVWNWPITFSRLRNVGISSKHTKYVHFVLGKTCRTSLATFSLVRIMTKIIINKNNLKMVLVLQTHTSGSVLRRIAKLLNYFFL